MTTTSLTLDVWQIKNVYVKANQGEVNSRFLEITLTDKGIPFNIANKTVVFYATKPDHNVIYNLCTIEDAANGVISVCLTSQMSAVAGKMPCEIHIVDREQATLKAVGLEMEIVKCADLEHAEESRSEFTALERAMAEYDEACDIFKFHLDSRDNPHEVTTAQIGAANAIHTHNFNSIENKPTTLSGYGITDAVPTSRTINSKALSSNITLTYSDVGASSSGHTHSFSEIESKPTTISGYGIVDAVPTSRTINSKALSSNITLTYSDVDAASSGHAHSFSEIESKPTTISGYGIVDAVPTSRTVNSKALSSNITLTYSDVGAASSDHTHSFSEITNRPTTLLGYGITDAASSIGVGDVSELRTTAKTVVGAINELYSTIDNFVNADEIYY